MKMQEINKIGLLSVIVGVMLSLSSSSAYGVSHTFSVESDLARGADVPAIHPPIPGTILSATITILTSSVDLGGTGNDGADDVVSFYIGGLFRGLLEPGESTHTFVVDPADFHFITSGLELGFALEEANNPELDAFAVIHESTLDVTVRPDSHRTPDAGSTLLLLGAGLTALVTMKRRMN